MVSEEMVPTVEQDSIMVVTAVMVVTVVMEVQAEMEGKVL